MVTDAVAAGLEARWFAGEEVYCGRELRRGVRALGLGHTVKGPGGIRCGATDGDGATPAAAAKSM